MSLILKTALSLQVALDRCGSSMFLVSLAKAHNAVLFTFLDMSCF